MAFKCTQNKIKKCCSKACKELHAMCLINGSDLSYHPSSSPLVTPLPRQPPDLLGGSLLLLTLLASHLGNPSPPHYCPRSMPLLTLSNLHVHICSLAYHAPPILAHQFCENRDHVCFLPPLCIHCLPRCLLHHRCVKNKRKPVKWLIMQFLWRIKYKPNKEK